MSHYVDPARLEADQKDLLISELKAENFELRNKERHYNQMYDDINFVERECAKISEEKRSMEEEMRIRGDHDSQTIRKLRDQNESLVLANKDFDARIAAIRSEIAHYRAVNDSKTREIGELNDMIHVKEDDNHGLRAQISDLENQIHLCDDVNRSREGDIDDLNKRIGIKNMEIDDKIADIDNAEADIARLKDNIGKAKHDQDKLRCRLDDEIDRNHRFQDENSKLFGKGSSLVVNIRDLEAQCASRDAQIDDMRDEIDRMKRTLHSLEDNNHSMEDELDALNRHSEMLHKQNDILNHELSDALASEEYVKKDKIANVKQDNDEILRYAIHKLSEAKARSPTRKR